MNNKNLEIVDELMQAIIQTDAWTDEVMSNPEIQASEMELEAVMKEVERYAPKKLVNQLSDAVAGNVAAHELPAMLYGMRVAYAIGDVSRRPSDLSHLWMQRAGRVTA